MENEYERLIIYKPTMITKVKKNGNRFLRLFKTIGSNLHWLKNLHKDLHSL